MVLGGVDENVLFELSFVNAQQLPQYMCAHNRIARDVVL